MANSGQDTPEFEVLPTKNTEAVLTILSSTLENGVHRSAILKCIRIALFHGARCGTCCIQVGTKGIVRKKWLR